jgi:hypothetical protein
MKSGRIGTPYLTSALDGGEWSVSRPGRFTTRERDPSTHWVGLDAVENRNVLVPAGNGAPRYELSGLPAWHTVPKRA